MKLSAKLSHPDLFYFYKTQMNLSTPFGRLSIRLFHISIFQLLLGYNKPQYLRRPSNHWFKTQLLSRFKALNDSRDCFWICEDIRPLSILSVSRRTARV